MTCVREVRKKQAVLSRDEHGENLLEAARHYFFGTLRLTVIGSYYCPTVSRTTVDYSRALIERGRSIQTSQRISDRSLSSCVPINYVEGTDPST